nr:uncharacterized mitochondrial protein AtMg00810-like [Tanacetum cinerariifolium]
MSSIGELIFFLGLQVKQKNDGIFISQDKYIAEILSKFRLTEGKLASTPIYTEKPLLKDPDVKKIFRYLKGKPHLGLWYPKDSLLDLVAYSDNDYAGASLDRKSTTGGCQFFGCRLISWQCKKQTVVATSSTEAEYVVAVSCCAQLLWIQNQLLDYGPTSTGKDSVFPIGVRTRVLAPSYMSLITFMYLLDVPLSTSVFQISSRRTLSYAFSRSRKARYRSLSSQPSLDHSLPKLHGVAKELDTSIVATNLRITFVFKDWDDFTESSLFRHLRACEDLNLNSRRNKQGLESYSRVGKGIKGSGSGRKKDIKKLGNKQKKQ